MGYRIQYEKDMIKTPINFRMSKKAKGILCVFLSTCVVVMVLSATGTMNKIKDWLLPGNPEVTEAALNTLVSDLKQGETFNDAVTAFCQEILDHAYTPG